MWKSWIWVAAIGALARAETLSLVSTQANQFLCDSPGTSASYCGSQSGRASASATSTASDGYVAVSISGGAYGMSDFAQAFASSFFSRDYLFSNGSGSGLVCYEVALQGSQSGYPAGNRIEVRYNGNLYTLGGSGFAIYSFTQTFEFGKPFQIQMSVDVRNSWMGIGAESGSSTVSARLVGMTIQPEPSSIPEPSAAYLWIGGLLLIGFGLQRRRPKR